MKQVTLILLLALSFWGCEWQPEPVNVDREVYYHALNLRTGDTTTVALEGHDFQILQEANAGLVAVNISADGQIQFIGCSAGQTELALSYQLNIIEAGAATIGARAYFKLTVSDGIPLELALGNWQVIDLADQLSTDQLQALDSIAVHVAAGGSPTALELELQGTELALRGRVPGHQLLEVQVLDDQGAQIVPLLFAVEIAIQKIVLAELFTNAGCVNCPIANQAVDRLYEEYPSNFAAIRYHVFWTDPNDPMNLYNPDEVEARRLYYGGSYAAPRLLLDGNVLAVDYNTLQASVNSGVQAGAELYIWRPTAVSSTDSLLLTFTIQNYGGTLAQLACWSVLTEDSVHYAGTNGETVHLQVMRDMFQTEISTLDSSLELTHSLKLTPDFSTAGPYQVTIFVQDRASQLVLQAAVFTPLALLTGNVEPPFTPDG